MAEEMPVFYDKSGKRWKIIKFSLLVILFTSIYGIWQIAVRTIELAHKPDAKIAQAAPLTFPPDNSTPSSLAYTLPKETPVIGEGVFLRVLKLHPYGGGFVAADVYTGIPFKVLSGEEIEIIGSNRYVIDKYGKIPGKNIVLTFDDGPHPIYTSQILDILSEEQAHSTFFTIGVSVVKYPELAQRIVREGHDVANHTFTHADLDLISDMQAYHEINQTQRIMHSATSSSSALFRIPYGGHDEASLQDDKRAILEAQRQGYVVSSYDIDTNDWGFDKNTAITLPELDGTGKVFLLHDGGGDRSKTVAYLQELIRAGKDKGYEFTSLSRLFSDYELNQAIQPSIIDQASFIGAESIIVKPREVMNVLFFVSVVLTVIGVFISIILAELQITFHKPKRRRNGYYPPVSVIIPAYNEEKVLQKTVSSILRSSYRNLEVIIVDDGSKDNTWPIIQKLRRNKKVRGYKQENGGKSSAVNHGIRRAKGEILISIDADTVFLPTTVGKLTRYFYYEKVGAVAGVVKVGNSGNWIAKWQALEYITSINIERAAQAYLNAIVIAPGACSAWRKQAILDAGGYSGSTMAEDCDLTLAIHKAGYKVLQDFGAIALTECPENLRDLSKQRFRWLFGTLQSFWKHRDMFFRKKHGWLGLYVLPRSIFGIFMQLIFTPLLLIVAFANIISGNLQVMVLFSVIAFVILLLNAVVALFLARERARHLLAAPGFRLVYSPLRSILLYASAIAVLGGLQTSWNKVVRHGTVLLDK